MAQPCRSYQVKVLWAKDPFQPLLRSATVGLGKSPDHMAGLLRRAFLARIRREDKVPSPHRIGQLLFFLCLSCVCLRRLGWAGTEYPYIQEVSAMYLVGWTGIHVPFFFPGLLRWLHVAVGWYFKTMMFFWNSIHAWVCLSVAAIGGQ